MKAIICDICGKREEHTKAGAFLPEEWAQLIVANGKRYCDDYHLCPECVPAVEGKHDEAHAERIAGLKA